MNNTTELPLQQLYRWEKSRADDTFLSQKLEAGQVQHYSWSEVLDQARRMAAFLQAHEFPAGSRIAILSEHCAHGVMANIAIMLAGYVSVPLQPNLTAKAFSQTLAHCRAVAIFVGKLDKAVEMLNAIPQGRSCVTLPGAPPSFYPSWDDIIEHCSPLDDQPQGSANDIATISYTSDNTGVAKAVKLSLADLADLAHTRLAQAADTESARRLSHWPITSIAERVSREMQAIYAGTSLLFSDEPADDFLLHVPEAPSTALETHP